VCHQAAGAGVPGSFPRLAGRAGALADLPAGRKLMMSAVLDGIAGKLQADGQTVVGVMPPLAQLSDADIAAVLNYVGHLDHRSPKAFTAAEVAAIRAQPALSSAEVNALAKDPALVKAAP
jgi:mono/diheme cytochrome c family protein